VAAGTLAFGEVGLLGEIRPVSGTERRLREAARLGFRRAIVPPPGRDATAPVVAGIDVAVAETLREAIGLALADADPAGSAEGGTGVAAG
jgi:DNA repair protein RadA/Sms